MNIAILLIHHKRFSLFGISFLVFDKNDGWRKANYMDKIHLGGNYEADIK